MYNIANFQEQFPNSPIMIKDNRLYSIWMEGNYYKRKVAYHGAYPPSFLRRVKALFPNAKKILHVFSGAVEKVDGEVTIDINPDTNPDVIGDAHKLSEYFPENFFQLAICDPVYNQEHAKIYGCKMPRTHLVMQELYKVVEPLGYVVWLSTHPPLYKRTQWELSGLIMLHCGTNRVVRAVTIMRRRDDTISQ
jgi:hypothetical protein